MAYDTMGERTFPFSVDAVPEWSKGGDLRSSA